MSILGLQNWSLGKIITPYKLKFKDIEDFPSLEVNPDKVSKIHFCKVNSLLNQTAPGTELPNSKNTISTHYDTFKKVRSKTQEDLIPGDLYKPNVVEDLKKKYDCLNNKLRKKDSLIEREKIEKRLLTNGYLVNESKFNNSKCKMKDVSILRNPINKEFPSMKNDKSPFSESPKLANQSSEYSVLKKRRLSRSVKRVYTSEFEIEDYMEPAIKHYFKLYLDDDIGITPKVQFEMIASVSA